ncbi:LutC/YkgG family protein [Filimonas effusa]|uniref:Lactate utilization protein B/C n=1 Tax=Filimonas effusa TaxID=2508721 RepID=A0A4V1M9W2_9BACT|nr:LUD domain-containing protein [Filimonas effusa]RXK83064.1 lactate utilization protein B/C [Filimonas effusa]
MNAREKILSTLRKNQPAATALPDVQGFVGKQAADADKYIQTFRGIGGSLREVNDIAEIIAILQTDFAAFPRKITTVPQLAVVAETDWLSADPHTLEDVGVMVMEGNFGVCENGAVWVTEQSMGQRAAPFIAEHLIMLLSKQQLVATMHDAYVRIAERFPVQYGFGAFIAGPSKTADIEQSLVLGAHGPRTMTMLLLP